MSDLLQHTSQELAFIKDLRAELFDFGKRNQNIFFKGGRQFLELIDLPEDLELIPGKKLQLQVDDEELLNALDGIRLKANKNKRELGFNQLNLVSVFVEWYHPEYKEHVVSPLVITPIELRRKKGISVSYELLVEARPRLNPALIYLWKQLFRFSLPPSVTTEAIDIQAYLLKEDGQLNIQINPDGDLIRHEHEWQLYSNRPSIGNFDFRRMSLLQDYDMILANPQLLRSFEARTPFREDFKNLRASYNVIELDASQEAVIEAGLSGQNLVVQGPPGTGKSQTIVNLCSNLIARGKRILLVSDKRAALDVVFSRLQGVGLGDLGLFSYDSQVDRKALVQDLKTPYQAALSNSDDLGTLVYEKQKISEQIHLKNHALQRYHDELHTKNDHGYSLNDLFVEGLQYQQSLTDLDAGQKFSLPSFHDFSKHEAELDRLQNILLGFGYDGIWSQHPAAKLNSTIWQQDEPGKKLKHIIDQAKTHLNAIDRLSQLGYDSFTIDQLQLEFVKAGLFHKLVKNGLYELTDPDSFQSKKYDKLIKRYRKLQTEFKKVQKKNLNWTHKFELSETEEAIEILEKYQNSWKRFFNQRYRSTVRAVEQSYDFAKHTIQPGLHKVLKSLEKELSIAQSLEDLSHSFKTELNIDQIDFVEVMVRELRLKMNQAPDTFNHLLQQDGPHIESFYQLNTSFERFKHQIRQLSLESGNLTVSSSKNLIESLEGCLEEIPAYAHPIRKLMTSDSMKAYGQLHLSLDSLKAHVIDWEIEQNLNLRYWLKNTTVVEIQSLYKDKADLIRRLNQVNRDYLNLKQAIDIQNALKLCSSSVVGMDDNQRQKKKSLQQAKRLLEREFSKSQRHKSIRELLDNGAGDLMMLLKPIWLMSPHAIADTFDLETAFDVIIYDEASQARVEDAFPSLLRAEQYIIFGDEKQMPPSNYFRKGQNEDLPESLLSYLAPKSVSMSLKWHYRSDSRALIAFSNDHFYNGQLEIIPSPVKNDAPLKLVYLDEGKFTDRKNKLEAQKVIACLKTLLFNGEKSIGIVAFSLEQAQLIEEVLENESRKDPVFAEFVNGSYAHYEKGVYQGLFIKNLENVQGDERDIMIISSAYGFNQEGGLRQYYGPLSLQGGERRLNVLLTRARKQMVLVTSLTAEDISSDQEGVSAFKAFLRYVQNLHQGETAPQQIEIEISQKSEALFNAYSTKNWTVTLSDAYNRYRYPELLADINER